MKRLHLNGKNYHSKSYVFVKLNTSTDKNPFFVKIYAFPYKTNLIN